VSIQEYIDQIEVAQKAIFKEIFEIIQQNIDPRFAAEIQYRMPSFVVPLTYYPRGYHCSPNTALPFISLAAQKNYIALYHMGIYVNPELLNWFLSEHKKWGKSSLDMGKSCIRFKIKQPIPFELIAELVQKMSLDDWILSYESIRR
jgi:uncharacterized protein YdhG (YjbR/CyaY superfamily)